MLKFLVKVLMSLYSLKLLMDQVDTLHVGRYWSEVLCLTIMIHLGGHGHRNFVLKFLVKVFISLYVLNMLMVHVDTFHVRRYWSKGLSYIITTHLGDIEVKATKFCVKVLS